MEKIYKWIFISLVVFTLLSCASPINQANFDRIRTGMTIKQVIAILGPPSKSAALSAGNFIGTTISWENHLGMIIIQFINGRVKIKRFIWR